jgi:PhnB protein
MSVLLNPYLHFRGEARAAMEFYASVFGGELALSTYGEMPGGQDPADQDKVMHGRLDGPDGLVLMGSDAPSSMAVSAPSGFAVSLSGDDEAALRGWWDALSDGGSVTLPLERAPWGDSFGMLSDRFGVAWMVNIQGSQPALA